MQWTPTNVTRTPAPDEDEMKPAASETGGYKAFLPWVKPLPKNLFPPPVDAGR